MLVEPVRRELMGERSWVLRFAMELRGRSCQIHIFLAAPDKITSADVTNSKGRIPRTEGTTNTFLYDGFGIQNC